MLWKLLKRWWSRLKFFNRSNHTASRYWQVLLVILLAPTRAQEPAVVLNQGPVLGVKIFPESSRVPIDAFLGVPYAAAPVGRLRFAAPEKHAGWKGTFLAQEPGPPCLQPPGPGPGGSAENKRPSEDCLYINIWTPDNADRRAGRLPVVVIFSGASWDGSAASGAPLPGQDLAAEGLVVAWASWRAGPLGFLCLAAPEARGNLGLLDQYFALLWLRENAVRFGGDPARVTLMGHAAGASAALYHTVSPRTKGLFSRAILMSPLLPVATSSLRPAPAPARPSRLLAAALGCLFESAREMVYCLREKSTEDIFKAFKTQYQGSNWTDTATMGPVVDAFLEENDQYIPTDPMEAIHSGKFHRIPIMTGITTLDGTDSSEQWQELARQGYHQLRHYVEFTALPHVLSRAGLSGAPPHVREVLRWAYGLRASTGDAWALLRRLRALHADALHAAPHARLVSALAGTQGGANTLYVYSYRQQNGVDLYGNKSNSSGAAHGSELPYLLGPTLYQQLTRRRLTQQEEKLSKRLRVMWAEFIKYGYPTPPRQYEAWRPYTLQDPVVHQLGGAVEAPGGGEGDSCRGPALWNDLLPRLANMSAEREPRSASSDLQIRQDKTSTLRHAVYSLLGLVGVLSLLLLACVVLLKRQSGRRGHAPDSPFGSF